MPQLPEMIPLWSGIANSWDCDEMGHMNVRVYSEKAMEGIGTLAGLAGMGHTCRPKAQSTLLPREQHIRYMREVFPGMPLTIRGCVHERDETSLVIYQEMCHGDGELAAVFRTRLVHVETESGKPFPWSRQARLQLDTLAQPSTDAIKPRGVDPDIIPVADDLVTSQQAKHFGTPVTGLGIVPASHCDAFGRMQLPWFVGRISDSTPTLLYDWRTGFATSKPDTNTGMAVLECRLVCRAWPRAGDRLVIHSGLVSNTAKAFSLIHWILDPDNGRPWASAEVLCVMFDLDTRKTIPIPPRQTDILESIAPRGMKI